jgi:hypothetical protein
MHFIKDGTQTVLYFVHIKNHNSRGEEKFTKQDIREPQETTPHGRYLRGWNDDKMDLRGMDFDDVNCNVFVQ